MDRIAFMINGTFLYWTSIVLTLAVAVAICFFFALYLWKSGKMVAGAVVVPMAMVLSLVFGRFMHWYSSANSYDSYLSAITDYSSGGYALTGVFIGCALAAVLVRLLYLTQDLPEMLDCMCLAGSAGIAVGRLSSFFNASDRGQIVESVKSLPWVYPVTNAVSGVEEYRLATFLIQAMAAGVLFVVLVIFYIAGNRRGSLKNGDTSLIFLLCYGASQVVLDSTRYDSLFFRSNGFVSIVQVLCALAIGLAIAVFSVRLVKNKGFRFWYLCLWIPLGALIGGAGYMEYYVQRHGNEAVFAYSIMSACLAAVVAVTLVLRFLAGQKPAQAEETAIYGIS